MLSNIHDSLGISIVVKVLVGGDKLSKFTSVDGIMFGETPDTEESAYG